MCKLIDHDNKMGGKHITTQYGSGVRFVYSYAMIFLNKCQIHYMKLESDVKQASEFHIQSVYSHFLYKYEL